jgi:hypothetical protein
VRERYPVEQLARMPDEEMVQRQFDIHNLRYLIALLIAITVFRFFAITLLAAIVTPIESAVETFVVLVV